MILYEQYLDQAAVMTTAERERVKAEIDTELEEAIAFAESSPHPVAEEAYDDVYSFSPLPNFPG